MAKKHPVPESVKLDGVSFNKASLLGYKSEAEFLKAMKDEAYAHLFEGENREAKLKELYTLGHAKPAEVEAPAQTEQKAPAKAAAKK